MRSGFTLLELSVVLAIIGLLAGGVMVGQNMIRQAELRAVLNEYRNFVTATSAFKMKYKRLPGDIGNATRFWGRQAATADCITNTGTAVSVNGTCDGNADGVIFTAAAANQSSERFQFWRQLSLEGLLEGSYTGRSGSANGTDSDIGINVPASQLQGTGWTAIGYSNFFTGNGSMYAFDYGPSVFIYGLEDLSTFTETERPALTPQEAYNIDFKIDDGRPAAGIVVARYWNNACAAADDGSSAEDDLNASYRVADDSILCALFFTKIY